MVFVKKTLDKWQLGVTFGFRAKNGYFASDDAKKEAEEIAKSGADWVVLVVTVFQESFCSAVQFRHFAKTPNDNEVVEMINYLHKLGLKVQLRPMLETCDGGGRLHIWFPSDSDSGIRIPGETRTISRDWFNSMTERAVYYAQIAESTGCEMYCLDSELDRIMHYNNEWKGVVSAVREVYSGVLTSCHTTHTGIIDFEKTLSDKNHWFYDLDMLSLSCYHSAATKAGATLEEMKENYKSQLERFKNIYNIYQKPIFFGECGCASIEGAAMSPAAFDWRDNSRKYDEKEQATYLEAVIETFEKEPWWYGLYWWKWDEHVPRPNSEKGFTIKGKKACQVYRKWGELQRNR